MTAGTPRAGRFDVPGVTVRALQLTARALQLTARALKLKVRG